MNKTYLDKIALSSIEKYELENKKLPILMQKYPWLVQVARNVYEKNINLTMIEDSVDYAYFILGIIYRASIINGSIDGFSSVIDIERFFKILEDYLVLIFDIKKIETAIFIRKRRNRKMNPIEEKILIDLIKKLELKNNIFDLINIKTYNSSLKMIDTMELNKYTNLLKNIQI